MTFQFEEKVAWITGGNSGIGFATAKMAAEAGVKVAITGLDQTKLDEAADKIESAGGTVLAFQSDVTSSEQTKETARQIVDQWGRLDFVCANAGINGTWAPIDDLTPEEWSKTIDINLTGTYLTIHHAVPHLKAAGGGSIVLVSSVNGTRIFSNEGASAYATSKAGQLALSQMLALELAHSKIRVNTICPGAIETGIQQKTNKRNIDSIDNDVEFPKGRIPLTGGAYGTPDEVAQVILFLFSDLSSHVTGTPIWIDGAESLLQG